jgi:hypothetical protein
MFGRYFLWGCICPCIWQKGVGVTDLLSNEYTYAPQIQAFEQGSKTVAYFALNPKTGPKS